MLGAQREHEMDMKEAIFILFYWNKLSDAAVNCSTLESLVKCIEDIDDFILCISYILMFTFVYNFAEI